MRRQRDTRLWVAFLLALLGSFGGCGFGDEPLVAVDPQAVPLQPTYDQVRAIVDRSCVPCHGGQIAPDFSTCEDLVRERGGLRSTVLDGGSMPPGAWPRLDASERLLIERWLDQGACAPCTTCR